MRILVRSIIRADENAHNHRKVVQLVPVQIRDDLHAVVGILVRTYNRAIIII